MGEALFTILLFFGVIAVTAVVFGGWVIVSIVRFIGRALGGFGTPSKMISTSDAVICPRERCAASNPSAARYCRRCGQALPQAQRVVARRAAMW